MTDGDHYASYASVQYLYMNSGLTTSGNQMFDDTAVEEALDQTMGIMHGYLGLSTLTKLTGTVDAVELRRIQVDLVGMMILRARHFQTNNLADAGAIVGFWQITPALTKDHMRTLDRIRERSQDTSWNFDTRSGEEVS